MNIFLKYTARSLRKNKTRTLVTIIGILLSMSLFTAVLTGAYSTLQYLINQEIATTGAWLGALNSVTPDNFKKIADDKDIKDYTYLQEIGWASVETGHSPYLLIQSIPEDFTDLYPLFIKGRLPENDSEIILPSHLFLTDFAYHTGDDITLQVGTRQLQGNTLGIEDSYQEKEQIVNTSEKTYTIVGIYDTLILEANSTPGYYALTRGSSDNNYTVLFTLKNPRKYYDFLSHQHYSRSYTNHNQLLRFNGVSKDKTITRTMYGFAGILCFLIAFGSISLVYNSFSISVSERIRQFGILQSIGATKKQIWHTVFYEAMILSIIAIPLGILLGLSGIGMTFYLLKDQLRSFFGNFSAGNGGLIISISPMILMIATVVCLFTTLISAFLPARKALRIPPITAIRQTDDIKISPREVKTPRFIQKAFGFEGMMALKNFKRNRKRYLATILSLSLSIVLFVSTSFFVSSLKEEISTFAKPNEGRDLVLRINSPNPDISLISNVVENTEGVESYFHSMAQFETFYIPRAMLDNSYQKSLLANQASNQNITIRVAYLDDASFIRYANEQNISTDKYFNKEKPLGILVNTIQSYSYSDSGSHYENVTLIKNISLPATLTMAKVKEIEGYILLWQDEYGRYLYYPEEEASSVFQGNQPDPNKLLAIPVEDAYEKFPMSVGDFASSFPSGMQETNLFLLVYPESMLEANVLFDDDLSTYQHSSEYIIQSKDHAATKNRLFESLESVGIHSSIYDEAASREQSRMIVTVINVFSYSFIILISLICIANVFNTISTSITLRKREFATLRSIGMSRKSFTRMMNHECILYGVCSILLGMPIAFAISYAIYRIANIGMDMPFSIPPSSLLISIASVFLVVFITMLYATHRIQQENTMDALKDENI